MGLQQRLLGSLILWYLLTFGAGAILVWLMGWAAAGPPASGWIWGGLGLVSGLVSATIQARKVVQILREIHRFLHDSPSQSYSAELPEQAHNEFYDLSRELAGYQATIRTSLNHLSLELERLQIVMDSMSEGVIGVDENQRILLINQAACNMFRLKETGALNRPVWEQVRHPRIHELVSQSLENNSRVDGEISVTVPIPRNLAIRVAPFNAHSRVGAAVVMVDVTELRRLERVRQEFATNASHELKTPITGIKACIETLLDGAVDDIECRDRFLTTIEEQSNRLDLLVRDLLQLSKIESEPQPRDPRPVSVAEIVAGCLDRNRQAASRKNIELSSEVPETPLDVLGDEDSLEHILDNLVDNAIKYTNPGGKVVVRCQSTYNGVTLYVTDTGIGIPQQHLSRIFERFYRVDRHRSREQGGTGLGLAIVKHLVHSLGGRISVSSQVGSGTSFEVQLNRDR